eukprot:863279-Rhodomonas_salina.1
MHAVLTQRMRLLGGGGRGTDRTREEGGREGGEGRRRSGEERGGGDRGGGGGGGRGEWDKESQVAICRQRCYAISSTDIAYGAWC